MELQYDAHGPRPADAIRRLEVPQRVRRAEWAEGEIDAWVRESGIWYGRFRASDSRVSLVLGNDLRRISDAS